MTYKDKEQTLINYMKSKIEEKDWHAVSDAANDLRVLEAKHINERGENNAKDDNSLDSDWIDFSNS